MVINIYINNFFFTFNNIPVLVNLKKSLIIKYKIKDIKKVKSIIKWQIIKDLFIKIIKISKSIFIRNLFKEKNLTNCNTLTILMKNGLLIKINKLDNYNKANLEDYQKLIRKFIFLAYKINFNIAFVIKNPNKYNADSKKKNFRK